MLMITHYWEVVPEDSRFHYRFDGSVVSIRWIPPGRNQVELQFMPPNAVTKAYDYMIMQGAPAGSVRLGSAIATVARAVGIQPCQSCRERHLSWNQVRGRR